MAEFRLEINCDNAAFGEETAVELKHILREVAYHVDDDFIKRKKKWSVRDTNGNVVGHAEYTEEG